MLFDKQTNREKVKVVQPYSFPTHENRCTCVDEPDPLCVEHWDDEANRFERDAAEWERKSEPMSVVRDMTALPEYQRIIGLGPVAVPLIIERMRTRPGHWFAALKSITNENFGTMTVPDATRCWIEWYDSGGYAAWLATRNQQ